MKIYPKPFLLLLNLIFFGACFDKNKQTELVAKNNKQKVTKLSFL